MFDEDAEDVIDTLTARDTGDEIEALIRHRLHDVEGFAALPSNLRCRIQETAALLYATGYLHAVTARKKPPG